MILDISVILAIARREPGFEQPMKKIMTTASIGIGTPTLVEAGIVLEARMGLDGRGFLERFLSDLDIATVPIVDDHWREALAAYHRYGNGRHPAALNFGDCLTYAVAKLASEPLLFLGDDFAKTDVFPA